METKIRIESPVFNCGYGEITAMIINQSIDASAKVRIRFAEFFQFASNSDKSAIDFFFISSFVYGVDRFVERHPFSTDGWSRLLNVTLPVYEVEKWNENKNDLEEVLSFLTGDYWELSFIENCFEIKSEPLSDEYVTTKFKQVNLFSGGLDSLIGAIDFLSDMQNKDENVLLVSHSDSAMKNKGEQNAVYDSFPIEYKKRAKRVALVEVVLCESTLNKREKTFRSRSLLFLGIAVLVADLNKLPIVVPENGSVSLNYPLSASRRGACSTRTTHPTFLLMVSKLLGKLSLTSKIENPYEYKTKGEMVRDCGNHGFLESIVHLSNSCGKKGHVINRTFRESTTHCGVCMPCTYRKASLINIVDKTKYGDDLNKEKSGWRRKRPFLLSDQGQDINAMLDFLGRDINREEIKKELILNGIRDLFKIEKYIDLVEKTRDELKVLVDKTCTVNERRKKAGL
jgi:hypothetical protein